MIILRKYINVDYQCINNKIDTSNYIDGKQQEYPDKGAEAFNNRFQSCNEVLPIYSLSRAAISFRIIMHWHYVSIEVTRTLVVLL